MATNAGSLHHVLVVFSRDQVELVVVAVLSFAGATLAPGMVRAGEPRPGVCLVAVVTGAGVFDVGQARELFQREGAPIADVGQSVANLLNDRVETVQIRHVNVDAAVVRPTDTTKAAETCSAEGVGT